MTWTCPACRTHIEHNDLTAQPQRVYRCHVCRLELVVDDTIGKLTGAPFEPKHTRRKGDRTPQKTVA
jgi:hypothetical protein